MNTINEMQICR